MLLKNTKLFEFDIVKKIIVKAIITLCTEKSIKLTKIEIDEFLENNINQILQDIINGKS